ncbi:hybrid sensor histidine kinase/response regulator [Cronbergia sp. UHCC 0137]|uniref:hybrid sensor histidine kinase/response regulator n=1 Tax=Cronbergia sp. UHCC 0137 TaxID=3110239 RepID=UPI002B213357|nr:hybrid sensor histidine kinase/response regulator [Cronbergia sp. UHCC 0137]MEA5616484.1 hybrid sensor histidine kinase/response regulator [Cronbergia sp. UHCC 0137]
MINDKELEIQMEFLEEANDYLNTLEGVLLEIETNKHIDVERINAAMRAAHSIKGGAAMMGFRVLSNLAHRIEDAFKVLKTRKNSLEVDTHLQSLMLSGVDWLRQIAELLSEGNSPDDVWLGTFCYPIFDELRDRLGEPPAENITSVLSSDEGQEIIPLLFETEVEECLVRLESLLKNPAQVGLQAEITTMASELGGLGEMLQLEAFTQLCQSVSEHLASSPNRFVEITQLALQAWRRSQALVLTNQRNKLPTKIYLGEFKEDIIDDLEIATTKIHDVELLQNNTLLVPDTTPIERKVDAVHLNKEHDNTVRVPSKQLEEINDLFGEIIIQRNGLSVQLERLRKLVLNLNQRVQILDQEHQELHTAYEKITPQSRLEDNYQTQIIDRIVDDLKIEREQKINLRSQNIMETIVQIAEVTTDIQVSVDDTDEITRKLNKTSKQLQRKLTQVRMRPVADLVERFPRAIRDLNVEYGKNVQLKIEGGNTLIERSILEALNDPLMHLLRNAFDHGIEDPATRQAQGKPEQGLIEIKAAHQSDRTIITIHDDGQGISLEKIRQRALSMGLDRELLINANDEELLSLIFEPGFTTSEKLTNLSGRGVGMDVVRNNLKLVQGDIKVNTQKGIGTTFTLSVPFTLSITRVLLVEIDARQPMMLAFPTDVVNEIFLLQNDQLLLKDEKEYLKWQDNTLPLMRLSEYFEFNCSRYNSLELVTPTAINASSILIIKSDSQPVAVQVDRCWGEQEVAIRQVEGNIPLPNGFSNCTILGDGRVVPLINATELLSWINNNQRPHRSNKIPTTRLKTAFITPQKQQLPARPTRQKGMILIVDDSINVRRYLALTLEKGGYQVEQAKDGQDAWEKLQNGLKVEAIICDIEMPRMDGYGFLECVNSNDELKNIPIAMLTSRSSNKHRQLAIQLGARAYFSKPYNEQELLRTVEEMIFAVRG